MFSIRQPISNSLDVVLLIVLDFVVINHTWSSEETCVNVNDQSVCYFKAWDFGVDWHAAYQLCNSINSTLPVIRNRNEQDVFANYLSSHIAGSMIWTAGRNYTYENWTWLDGRPYSNRRFYGYRDDRYQRNQRFSVSFYDQFRVPRPLYPNRRLHYICQYSGALCDFSNTTVNITSGCVEESDDRRSWYDARNQCLMTGGDLASLNDSDLFRLRRALMRDFHWTGLRKYSWRWNLNENTSVEDEIKYTNWSEDLDSLNGDCISINSSSGNWKAIECSYKLKVVCQRDFVNIDSSKSQGTLLPESGERESRSVSTGTFASVVTVGVFAIVISNIIVALFVRKYVYQRANASSNIETAASRLYENIQPTQRQANPDAVYTEIQLQPTYEEVSPRGK